METLKAFLKQLYYLIVTLPRDLKIIASMASIEWKYKKLEQKGEPVQKMFERVVQKHPDKACIIFDDRIYTYQDVS